MMRHRWPASRRSRLYTPELFKITDEAVLHDLMDRFSFATLVTQHESYPLATHLPFMLDRAAGEHGTLIAHMARANEQWHDFEQGQDVLAIFQGHHAYISPSWYETFPSAPTWNYMVVHAYGIPRIITDDGRIRALLTALVDRNEARFESPWPLDVPETFLQTLMKNIVMFELPIARLEGKFKLSQNQPARNQRRVVEALAASADPFERELAEIMRAVLSVPGAGPTSPL
jgi:transcriptional regulator